MAQTQEAKKATTEHRTFCGIKYAGTNTVFTQRRANDMSMQIKDI